jgi:hypothetical protein
MKTLCALCVNYGTCMFTDILYMYTNLYKVQVSRPTADITAVYAQYAQYALSSLHIDAHAHHCIAAYRHDISL